jgi:hypothetical protein
MLKRGKKTRHWDTVRASIKKDFERWEIMSCEICGGTFALSFAHRLKRRFITDDAELRMVALLDQECHNRLEYGDKQVMYDTITKIIENRN